MPCLDSRCNAWTHRGKSHCDFCEAPLNKDKKGGADDALLAKAAEEAYSEPARLRKKNGQKARATKKLAAEEKAKAEAADAAATEAVALDAKKVQKPTYLNAAAALKAHPFVSCGEEQMEVDAQSEDVPAAAACVVSEHDMKRLGLSLWVGPASLEELLKEPVPAAALPCPVDAVAKNMSTK